MVAIGMSFLCPNVVLTFFFYVANNILIWRVKVILTMVKRPLLRGGKQQTTVGRTLQYFQVCFFGFFDSGNGNVSARGGFLVF
jgi:hypothetical protein